MIDEQSKIKMHADTEYVYYASPMKQFVVKLKCNEFLNYIRDYNDFLTKLSEHNCTST